MPSQDKTDRRVLYTKMFLKESLLELMKEKAIDKITPTELCRKANINRNTFYSHDNGMEMLFSFVVNGSIALIRKWAATDLREPPDKVAVLIERIAYGGIDGMKTAGTPA